MALDDIYKEMILDHYKNPRNKRELPGAEVTCTQNNPLCGDEITVSANLEDGKLARGRVRGRRLLDQPVERLDDDRGGRRQDGR